ncbi:MFS transporter [Candidatus Bathyarchaeota archaeon]|nr:MFS transporter [Candidatus Bathyarchaeota archaeon]
MTEEVGFLSRQIRPFLVIFSGQAFSLFGSRLVQFSLVWYLTSQTGSAQVLTTASIAAILPQVVIAPFAGALVDRWNRRRVMMISDSLIAAAIMVLAVLFAFDRVEVWHIYAVMLFRSAGGAFQWPAMQASTSMMVPKHHLSRVAGLNQSLQGLVAIVAPPTGALLLELLPIQYVLAVDVVTALFAVGPLFFISIPQPMRGDLSARGVLADMKEGFTWIWSKKPLVMIMGISLMINLVTNPAFTLLPLLITTYFKGGAIELAWVQSANGLGLILGGIALGIWGGFKSKGRTAFSALFVSSLGLLGFSQTPADMFLVGIGFVFVFGFMNAIGNSSFFSVLQTVIPHEMQGRVFTLVMATSIAVSPIGLVIAGPVAELFGIRFWFVIAGATILIGSLMGFMVPGLKDLEKAWGSETE